jgi:polyisoprenoid-binding protein YceI
LAFTLFQVQAQSTWKSDNAHSEVQFVVTHMVVSEVSGNFEDFDITVKRESDSWEGADVSVEIEAKSINTRNEKRDKHLRSEDFFNVKKHPKITFESTSFKKKEGDNYELKGELTIRGETNTETLDVTNTGTIKDPYGNQRAGFKVRGIINRFDYNVKWNQTMDSGDAVVGEEVQIKANVEVIKKEE